MENLLALLRQVEQQGLKIGYLAMLVAQRAQDGHPGEVNVLFVPVVDDLLLVFTSWDKPILGRYHVGWIVV